MSLTITVVKTQVDGTQKLVQGTLTFDASYLTAGELAPPSLFGLYSLSSLDVQAAGTNATHAVVPVWNGLNGPLSTVKAFWGDNANVASAQLVEVTSTTDLSAVVCQFVARGA